MSIQEIRHPLIRHKLGLLRRADIGTNQEEMLKLVNRYFHCG